MLIHWWLRYRFALRWCCLRQAWKKRVQQTLLIRFGQHWEISCSGTAPWMGCTILIIDNKQIANTEGCKQQNWILLPEVSSYSYPPTNRMSGRLAYARAVQGGVGGYAGNQLHHRYPGQRSQVHHSGGGSFRAGGNCAEMENRTILLPTRLCRKLQKYTRKQKNRLGWNFHRPKRYGNGPKTKLGIWVEMKTVQIGKRGTPGGCAEPQQYGGDRNYPMSTGKGHFQ